MNGKRQRGETMKGKETKDQCWVDISFMSRDEEDKIPFARTKKTYFYTTRLNVDVNAHYFLSKLHLFPCCLSGLPGWAAIFLFSVALLTPPPSRTYTRKPNLNFINLLSLFLASPSSSSSSPRRHHLSCSILPSHLSANLLFSLILFLLQPSNNNRIPLLGLLR